MNSLAHSRVVRIINFGLKVVWFLNFAFIAFVTIFSVYLLINPEGPSVILNIPIHFSLEEQHTAQSGNISDNSIEIKNATGQLQINNPRPYQILMFFFGFSTVKFLFTLYVIYLLRKIFSTLLQENPFTVENGDRLRKIGISAILFGVFLSVYSLLTSTLVSSKISSQCFDIVYKFDLRLEYIYWGLFTLVIAEIFRMGAHMKSEQDLTI